MTDIASDVGTDIQYLFSYDGRLKSPLDVGVPYGRDTVFEVIGGRVRGDGAEAWARLDVRAQLLLDDVPTLYASYHGFPEVNAAVQAWLSDDRGTGWGDRYLRTTPRIETAAERHAWATRTLLVGQGRPRPERTVEYGVCGVT